MYACFVKWPLPLQFYGHNFVRISLLFICDASLVQLKGKEYESWHSSSTQFSLLLCCLLVYISKLFFGTMSLNTLFPHNKRNT
jgi:hypothetical protein